VGLSPETCRVKAFAKNKTQLLHLVGIIFTTLIIPVINSFCPVPVVKLP